MSRKRLPASKPAWRAADESRLCIQPAFSQPLPSLPQKKWKLWVDSHCAQTGCRTRLQTRRRSGMRAMGRTPPSSFGMNTIIVAEAPSACGRSSYAARRSRQRSWRALGRISSCLGCSWSAPSPAEGE
eukprot:6942775-Pyramimonas_sp.AAC.1